jgi:hypothetical protein
MSQVSYAAEVYRSLLEEKCFADTQGTNTFKALKKKVIDLAAAAGGVAKKDNFSIEYQQVTPKNLGSGDAVIDLENKQHIPDGGLLLTFLGETHNLFADTQRANQYAGAHNNRDTPLTCVVLERGLNYVPPLFAGATIREENLGTTNNLAQPQWGLGLDIKTRSMLVAGYLVLYMSSTNNTQHIAVFFGENHWDILSYIKQIINSSSIALKDRTVQCVLVPSNNGQNNLLNNF